jgi:hypothetical protein
VVVALAGLAAILVAILVSPTLQDVLQLVGRRLQDVVGLG